MIARPVRTLSSLVAVLLATACTNSFEIPIETPIRAKLDVAAFQRVLVAGFIAGGTEDVDGNLETTRLLRSQLRTKSQLRVIDSDVLPLVDVASEGWVRTERAGLGTQVELLGPVLVTAGLLTEDDVGGALVEAGTPGLTYTPTFVAAWGRRPAT